jgi:hypothetical protein
VRILLLTNVVVLCCIAQPPLAFSQMPAVVYAFTDSVKTTGHGDFYTLDQQHRRLYGAGRYVVDIDRKSVADSLSDSASGGFVIAPELGRGLARTGLFFDLRTARSLSSIPYAGAASVYDPQTKRAFLLRPDTTTVVDMKSGTVTARIAISGRRSICHR